ncbi:hypothetical protein M0Q39_04365 [Patescibacteria group bacterium]|nr:hypothetical protein [Patescibacteria group bacterium]MDD2287936.1 hypothetical protein [Bacteroidales bacterium]
MELEILKKLIDESDENKLDNVVSDGVLNLTEKQKETVNFVFWFYYLVETDLNDVLINCWNSAIKNVDEFIREESVKIIKKKVFKDENKDIDNLEYFRDKIKLYVFAKGESELSKILWKINDIRNDLSHNRIDKLEYKNRSLYLKETKKELLIDYLALKKNDQFVFKGSFKDVLGDINFNE